MLNRRQSFAFFPDWTGHTMAPVIKRLNLAQLKYDRALNFPASFFKGQPVVENNAMYI